MVKPKQPAFPELPVMASLDYTLEMSISDFLNKNLPELGISNCYFPA